MRRFLPILILVALIIVAGVTYLPSLSKYFRLKDKDVELGHEIERLEREIKALQAEEQLLSTDLVRLEEVVRQELGLVKPGEIVYKVVEQEIDVSPEAIVR
jgi:cell division protein FtsB